MAEGRDINRSSTNRVSVWNEIRLFVWKWEPLGEVKALLYISHGVAEYMGRYEQLGRTLSENGILAVGHDHVGHGKSGGERAHIEDFSVYVKDIVNHIQDLKEDHDGIPCFLMGHSMGGLLAVLAAAEAQHLLDGIILSSAGLAVDPQSAGTLVKVAAKIIAWVAPRAGLKPIDPNYISSIPEEVEDYSSDPRIYHEPLRAKWGSEMLSNIEMGKEKVSTISTPVLIFHGTNDNLVPFSASEYINSHISSKDKKFEVFDGDFHEVLHDRNQEKARQLIKDWILSHTSREPEP